MEGQEVLKSSANRTKLGRSFRKIFRNRISCNIVI